MDTRCSLTINVLKAALDRWLKLDKGEFIGRQALEQVKANGGPARRLIGLEMVERGIARDGYSVLSINGEYVGQITSGSPAPFLKTNIACALVPAALAASGEDVLVQVRPTRQRAPGRFRPRSTSGQKLRPGLASYPKTPTSKLPVILSERGPERPSVRRG